MAAGLAGYGAAQYTGSATSRIRYAMPDFQPEHLLAALPPLAAAEQEPAQSQHYRRFYGLNLARPGVRTRDPALPVHWRRPPSKRRSRAREGGSRVSGAGGSLRSSRR